MQTRLDQIQIDGKSMKNVKHTVDAQHGASAFGNWRAEVVDTGHTLS